MRKLFSVFFLVTTAIFSAEKPEILLFNCHFGSGHKMATEAIVESLDDCHVKIVDIYDEPLASLDPLGALIPSWSHEAIHNDLVKKEYNRFLNFTGYISPSLILLIEPWLEYKLEQYLASCMPDLIISCVPIVNSPLLKAAQKLHIPLLIVTTDIDIAAFCHGLKNIEVAGNEFGITIPFAKEDWFEPFGIKYSQEIQNYFRYGFGYPTRSGFSKDYSQEALDEIRQEYDIQEDENAILVMMGGCTSEAAREYAHLLLKLTDDQIQTIALQDKARQKIRLICLCGNIQEEANKKLMDDLNAMNIEQNPHVFIKACPGTPRIAEIVSLPELMCVISKPGGSTVNEMIKKRVPMIYHVAKIPLFWEEGNLYYGVSHDLGRAYCPETDDLAALNEILAYSFARKKEFLQDSSLVKESHIDFSQNLRSSVFQMLGSKGY